MVAVVAGQHMDVVMMLWAAAAGMEVLMAVCEPMHIVRRPRIERGTFTQ